MKLSISCRIAEGFLKKEEPTLSLSDLADVATQAGFDGLCMRASQIGVHSSKEQISDAKALLDAKGLPVTMVTGDFAIVYNNERGPDCLSNITPYLDLAESLGAPMLRVCIKTEDDLKRAREAASEAQERNLKLVHQCHAESLFETVDQIVDSLQTIDHPHFGLIFEAANLVQCQQEYDLEVLKKLQPWIFNVYLQNQRFHPGGKITLNCWSHGPSSFDLIQIPDSGGIDFPSIFENLKSIGYDGPVTVHQAAPNDGTTTIQDSAKATADYLRSLS